MQELHFGLFCWLWGYSISSKGFLLTLVDKMVIWVKFTHPVHFIHWFLKCRFTLAISYLTTSHLPWFMDLTFQVPMQYCSLQHQTLLPSPVTSTTGCCFHFGFVSSFFLEWFLHLSPVAYWVPTDLESSSFSVLSFRFTTEFKFQIKNSNSYRSNSPQR